MQHLSSFSACGKIILFGEHFVVHGSPAVAAPLTARGTTVEVLRDPAGGEARLESQAPGADLLLAKELLSVAMEQAGFSSGEGLLARVSSTLPVGYGLGSSASFAVALAGALSRAAGEDPTVEQLNQLALRLEQVTHGNPSGIDNTVVTHCAPLFFRRGEEPRLLRPSAPLSLVLASSGAPGSTKEAVASVGEVQEADPRGFARRCGHASEMVTRGAAALEDGDLETLGQLMDQNHLLLTELGVSTPGIEALVAAARDAGALGAKITGAGRGGFIVALVRPGQGEAVAHCLERAGSPLVIRPQEARS